MNKIISPTGIALEIGKQTRILTNTLKTTMWQIGEIVEIVNVNGEVVNIAQLHECQRIFRNPRYNYEIHATIIA